MLFEVAFTNGLEGYSNNLSIVGFSPIELLVADGGKTTRMTSLYGYLQTIEYAFTGVINSATGDIADIRISKSWCGGILKTRNNVAWECREDKTHTVIYDICADSLKEKYYVADDIEFSGTRIQPKWTKSLVTDNAEIIKHNIVSSIIAFTKNIRKYVLRWDDIKNKLVLENTSGNEISIDDVKEDDIYTLLKVINCLISRNRHLGVFIINCHGISDEVLETYNDIIRSIYGDTFVFLYNCNRNSKIARERLILPNYTLHSKYSK